MAFAFEKLIVYQKAVDFADAVCARTETFTRVNNLACHAASFVQVRITCVLGDERRVVLSRRSRNHERKRTADDAETRG